ncbi:MAG: FHA domain-containing protein [Gammaproteobacteria bacterium]|nr:FHA domain-containing protein [Gammaproteobacteria bacterium]MDH5799356.1 FHA domain-containing protein [Gammaproteobacteria bacterium]
MASKLILTLDGEIIKEYVIDKESITIGRKHENDIQLNDLTVSGRHALIINSTENTIVEDLGSTNGTLVNGNHIVQAVLQHGNVIQVGHHLFTFMNDEKAAYEPTMFVKAEIDETQIVLPDWDMNQEAVNMRGQPLGGLRKVHDPLGNGGIEMRKRFSTIGYQGKKLAQITRGDKGYTISGLDHSENRRISDMPLINGHKLSNEARPLSEKDVISIAGIEMEFYYIE